jgi:hypothetical protein
MGLIVEVVRRARILWGGRTPAHIPSAAQKLGQRQREASREKIAREVEKRGNPMNPRMRAIFLVRVIVRGVRDRGEM